MGRTTKHTGFLSSNLGFVVIQLLLAGAVAVLLVLLLYRWLCRYTDHGHEVEVPQITGLSIQEADVLLTGNHLKMEVIDSTYSYKVPLGTIVEQTPLQESKVKVGRTVYVVVNARQHRPVVMPDLIDISARQAENTLRQQGLKVAEIIYEPSAYRDLVLDVRIGEQSVAAGTRLTEGTEVTLVVGAGLGTGVSAVPDLTGRTLAEARSILLAGRLVLGAYEFDTPPDETNMQDYVVYSQSPLAGEQLREGQAVSIRLSTNLEKAATAENESAEDEFF